MVPSLAAKIDGVKSRRVALIGAQSCAPEAHGTVRAFHAAVEPLDMAKVIVFRSSEYPLDVVANEVKRLLAGVRVIGCATAGEFHLL